MKANNKLNATELPLSFENGSPLFFVSNFVSAKIFLPL